MGAGVCGLGAGAGGGGLGAGAVGAGLGTVSGAAVGGLDAGTVGVGLLHPAKKSKAKIIIIVFIEYIPPIISHKPCFSYVLSMIAYWSIQSQLQYLYQQHVSKIA